MGEGHVELRLLGPVEVAVDGKPLEFSAKERALVVALALDAGRVVSVDRLIDALWDGAPPETAAVSVRVHVSRVRRRLADAGCDDRIATREPGYVLTLVDGDTVDIEAFHDLTGQADKALARGEHERAVERYGAALALWRGPALGDAADSVVFRPDVTRLEEARLAAIEGRIDAELGCGRHGAVVGELESLCAEHPLRERFWAQRMLALYRSGRQADALRAYQDLRRHLGEELGLDPGPELARLEADVLAQDPALSWTPTPAVPAVTASVELPSGVVTFLLTDIEGSTVLWDRHRDEMAAALQRHDAIVEAIVAAHGGTLLKAKGEGDATLSVFRRASDTVTAAVALQRAIADEPWPPEVQLRVRMAIHTGEAHERDGDYFGPTVNRAARIRALAAGGEILVSQATAEVVHDRLPDDAALGELGAHRLAGVTRPEHVFAVRIRGLPGGDEAFTEGRPALPLPAALEASTAAFVGRDAELGELAAAWARAQRGERDVILVAGEPGIGKTSLVAEAARAAHVEDAAVLFGHCDEEALVPFQPFVEAFAHWVTSSPVAELRAALGPQAADLALLVPEVRHRLPGLADATPTGSPTERYRLFEAVPALLQAIAARAPVLLVLDDLHWADGPTLQLLLHTMRRTAGTQLLVLATYRDTEIFRTHPLAEALVELRRADAVRRLALRGLSRADVGHLISPDREPGPDEAGLADALWRDTEGSPLFVRESLRHLEEVGAVARDERGGWQPQRPIDTLGIPEGVKEVIGRRLTRLSEQTNDVLRTASVIGRQFDPVLVGAVTGTDVDAVLDTLDEASTAGVVGEVSGTHDRYEFTHALVRDALYDELSISRRVRMHQRVGEAIEALHAADLDAHLGELAYHFSQAAVAGVADKAIEYATRAADRALAGVAYEEAARLFALALETAEDAGVPDRDKTKLLLRQGEAQWRIGDPRTAQATLQRAVERARRSGDAEGLGRAALLYAGAGAVRWVWVTPGMVDEEAVERLEEALAALDGADSALRARLLTSLGVELHFLPGASDRCDELSREGVAMARRTGDLATLAYALCGRNLAVMGVAFAEDRLAAAEEAVALAEQLGDRTLAAFAHGYRFMALLDLDRIAEAKEALETTASIGDAIRDPLLAQQGIFGRGNWARLEGRFDEAERLHQEAFSVGQELGDAAAVTAYFAPMLEVRRLQGRLHEIAPAFDGERVVFPVSEEYTGLLMAWIHGEARTPDALRYLQEIRPELPLPRMAETLMLSNLARVVFHYGEVEHARWMYDRLLPDADKNAAVGANMCSGTVSHGVALLAATLGRRDEAVNWFDDALRRYEINGWAPAACEATGQLAEVTAESDPAGAEALAQEALAQARRLGMGRVAHDAEDLLARLRDQPQTPRAQARVTRRDRLRSKITAGGRRVVERLVHGASDEDLVRRFASPLAQRAIFGGMARAFQPAMAFGFEGEISFELRVPLDDTGVVSTEWWTIEVRGRKASAQRGRAPSPAVAIRVDLADFVRMSAGEPPLDAIMGGRIQLEGDPFVLLQASAMFGAVEPFELLDETPAMP